MTFFHEPGLRFPYRLLGVFIETGDENPAVHGGEEVAHSFYNGMWGFFATGFIKDYPKPTFRVATGAWNTGKWYLIKRYLLAPACGKFPPRQC